MVSFECTATVEISSLLCAWLSFRRILTTWLAALDAGLGATFYLEGFELKSRQLLRLIRHTTKKFNSLGSFSDQFNNLWTFFWMAPSSKTSIILNGRSRCIRSSCYRNRSLIVGKDVREPAVDIQDEVPIQSVSPRKPRSSVVPVVVFIVTLVHEVRACCVLAYHPQAVLHFRSVCRGQPPHDYRHGPYVIRSDVRTADSFSLGTVVEVRILLWEHKPSCVLVEWVTDIDESEVR